MKILQHRKISILELFIALSVQFSARAHIDPGDRTRCGGTGHLVENWWRHTTPCGELVKHSSPPLLRSAPRVSITEQELVRSGDLRSAVLYQTQALIRGLL